MKIHILRCGEMRVSETVPYGNAIDLKNSVRQLAEPDSRRVTLPVFCYLIEHPLGLLLVDTGWCRAISPRGAYDPGAAKALLPGYLAAFYRPRLPAGSPRKFTENILTSHPLCGIILHYE